METIIKDVDITKRNKIIRLITEIFISVGCGALIAIFGSGNSLIERIDVMFSFLIILFGFSLTAFTIISRSLSDEIVKERRMKASKLKKTLSSTVRFLLITMVAIIAVDLFKEFFKAESISVLPKILDSIIYSLAIMALINIIDIIFCLTTILLFDSKKNDGNDIDA